MVFEQIYRQILRAYANIWSKNLVIKMPKSAILTIKLGFERSLLLIKQNYFFWEELGMRGLFYLFQSHLDLAHEYWGRLLVKGDCVVDATCGNGHDSSYLAAHCLTDEGGSLYLMDLQEEAIVKTRKRLQAELNMATYERITFLNQCHSTFPETIQVNSVKLIVYNLGYLPGGDKKTTTQLNSTLESLKQALKLIEKGGAISITCYPGHEQGAIEEEQLLAFSSSLDPKMWSCCHHRWMNRHQSPSLLIIQSSIA